MKRPIHGRRFLLAAALLAAAGVLPHASGHNGGILVQGSAGELVTGFDNESSGAQTIGDRAFSLLFPGSLANDVPSFLSLANAPAGSESLPVGETVWWDFLPMTIGDLTSNLLYWDAQGSSVDDVQFGPLTQRGISMSLWTDGFGDHAAADGAPTFVPGLEIGTISSNNVALHAHRWFYLDAQTVAPEGIYLIALQLRMDGYRSTKPFYIAAATDNISAATLDNLALPWVADHVDALILEGDYNYDGVVDGADFLAWQRYLDGKVAPGVDGINPDGNRDGVIGGEDLDVWQANYGAGTGAVESASPAAAIPEPGSIALAAAGLAALLSRPKRW